MVNAGVFIVRASDWSERFLETVWAQDVTHDWLWDNAAILVVLGYEIEVSPMSRGKPTR